MIDNSQKLKNIYSWYDPREWIETVRNSRTTFVNLCSGEEFTIERVPIYSDHIFDIYQTRAVYPLPNTPKIILSDHQSDKKFLDVWIQRGSYNLQKLLQKCTADVLVLNLFKQLLGIMEIIVKKYGFFRLKEKMIKVSKGGFLQVWINQFEECCHRQYPLSSQNVQQDYKTMVQDLVEIFISFNQERAVRKIVERVKNQNFITFDKLRIMIQSIIKYWNNDFTKQKIDECKSLSSQLPKFLKNKIIHSLKTPKIDQSFSGTKKCPSKILSENNRSYPLIPKHQYKSSTKRSIEKCDIKPHKQLSEGKYLAKKSSEIKRKIYYDHSGNQHDQYEILVSTPLSQQVQPFTPVSPGNSLQPEKQSSQDRSPRKQGKKGFRDSGTTFATNHYHSIYSSGKTRTLEQFTSHANNGKQLQSLFSNKKQDGEKRRLETTQKFKFKVSKIIEQKPEDTPNTPQSMSKSENQIFNPARQSQIERDLNFLLRSDHLNDHSLQEIQEDRSLYISKLEEEMNNLLLN